MDGHGPVEIEPLPARASSSYQAIVDHLRREFVLGRLRPGDRLPSERNLAEHLGVARETLRQALRVLEGSGQIVITRGSRGGAIVQAAIVDPLRIRADIETMADSVEPLTEYRAVIEGAAAALAAERRKQSHLDEMDSAQEELLASSTLNESRHADTRFHLAIAAAAGNPLLTEAIEGARMKMFDTVDLLSFPFVKESSYGAHGRLLEAIRAGDGELAVAEMRAHLKVTREEFRRIVKKS
jgi:GntR family transcriptional regulator, transcriptional repressor for pyruvate dehydrogenase complex